MSFKYMLRLCLQPGFHTETKLQEAVDFCLDAKIDDVIFFIRSLPQNRSLRSMESPHQSIPG
jgi:hypothetical protein